MHQEFIKSYLSTLFLHFEACQNILHDHRQLRIELKILINAFIGTI